MKCATRRSLVGFFLFCAVALSFGAPVDRRRVEGVVVYDEDPSRPWKLGRYYIKDRKAGYLAECVVALSGPGLGGGGTNRTVVIDQQGFQFVPEAVAIRAGDTVRFTNGDDSTHNVMSNDGGAPFNVNMGKGETYDQQFKQPGGVEKPVRIGCIYHGSMRAWVYVFEHPFFAMTGADGRFQMPDVPPGAYTLSVAHPAGRLLWSRPIEVREDQDLRLEVHLNPDDVSKRKP